MVTYMNSKRWGKAGEAYGQMLVQLLGKVPEYKDKDSERLTV
jgi:hypothetical protein